MPTYYTIDNGDRPFKVVVKDGIVDVYIKLEGGMDAPVSSKIWSDKPVIHVKAIRVFPGRSPLSRMTKFSGGTGPGTTGNTVLVQIAPLTYLHIGWCIQKITTPEEVVQFVSPIGNNDVPYPYFTTPTKVYLVEEKVWFHKTSLAPECVKDPYDQYYDHEGLYKTNSAFDKAHTAGFHVKILMRSTYRASEHARVMKGVKANKSRREAAAKKRADLKRDKK